jgi:hypothetical protein
MCDSSMPERRRHRRRQKMAKWLHSARQVHKAILPFVDTAYLMYDCPAGEHESQHTISL